MTVLLLDLANFAFRCRMSFGKPLPEGVKSNFTFQFLRNLRSLVDTLKPTSLVLVKEGSPAHRYEIYPEYKGQRKVKADDPEAEKKFAEIMMLKEQVDEALNFALKNLEVTVLKHAKCEADDLIANVARALAKEGKNCVIASSDKDFTQLLRESEHIRLYNFGTKEFVAVPDHDVLVYKAIVGDKSDNIPGIGGYGPKKALKLCAAIADGSFDPGHLPQEQFEIYERNLKLVKFYELSKDEWRKVQLDSGKFDPAACMIDFLMLDMPSLAEEPAYSRFVDTFGALKAATL